MTKQKNSKKLLFMVLVLFGIIALSSVSFAATPEEIQNSTTNGTEWLADQQNADGSFGTSDFIGTTDFAVLKLETHATEQSISPFDPSYQYSDEVQDGLNYLFSQAKTVAIGVQPDGNPDSNGDGIGVYFGSGINDYRVIYQTGIALAALTASEAPDRVVNVPGSPVNGQTYKQVAQNVVDFLAWAQTDSGLRDGGWYYVPNTDYSDNSVSGYAVLGLVYATSPANGFNCTVPAFVKTELSKWADYIQSDTTGGSGYTDPEDYYANVYNTGNLIVEFAFIGDESSSPRVTAAINYLVTNWNAPGSGYNDIGWRETTPADVTNYIATYSIMKAVQTFNLDTIGGIDWYQDFANAILPEQNADGSWPMSKWATNPVLSTAWALLTLEKAAPPVKSADIELTKTVNNTQPQVGNTIQYTLIINNRGPDPANDVTTTELLPTNLQLVSAIPSKGTYDPVTGIWNIGTMANGESVNLVLNALVLNPGPIVNQANATALEFDPDLFNNLATLTIQATAAPTNETEVPEVEAAGTIGMQKTGVPLAIMALAIIMVLGGMILPKRK
jgi:uncharacterized repeat protein (TIGR01451 family)